jgi:hypothetical protein
MAFSGSFVPGGEDYGKTPRAGVQRGRLKRLQEIYNLDLRRRVFRLPIDRLLRFGNYAQCLVLLDLVYYPSWGLVLVGVT